MENTAVRKHPSVRSICALLALLLCLVPCAFAEGGTPFANERAGWSLTLPDGFEQVSAGAKQSMLDNSRSDPDSDYMYDMDIWAYAPDSERSIMFIVQVKEPSCGSFEEECAITRDELVRMMEEDLTAGYGDKFLRLEYDAGTLRSTPAGDMLVRSYCIVLTDGSALYSVYADLYGPSAEYCFCMECYTREGDLAALDLPAMLDRVLPTVRVVPAALEREERPSPAANAGGWQEPALSDPASLYGPYDGSRDGILDFLAENNGSLRDVENGYALTLTVRSYPYPGQSFLLEDTPYGRVLAVENGNGDADYLFEGATYHIRGGRLSRTGPSEDLADLCSLCVFPYVTVEKVLGVREDANGYTYALVRSDSRTLMEYVSDGEGRLVSSRMYEAGDSGYTLVWELIGEKTESRPLPAKLSDLLESLEK